MTPQEVIKSFMESLTDSSSLSGTSKLDAAIKASSKYSGVQDAINAMKADQVAAEKEAVEEVLGSSYAGKTISQVNATILSTDAQSHAGARAVSNALSDGFTPSGTTVTVESVIKERKATIFLEKYCGIQLAKRYWIPKDSTPTFYSDNLKDSSGNQLNLTGNVDTGAITGSDANITLKAGDEVNGTILTTAIMQTLAQKDGVSLSGDTLVIGTGTEKTDRSIVPEIGNKYTATTSKAQNIKTGSNDWIVAATSYNDTITTGGADSISAGAGNDKITVGADYASIQTGAGNDTVEISAEVKDVTIQDLNSSDTLKISGTFNVGTAKIEDTMLVVTDKTGTRKIRLGDLDNAKNAKVGNTSTTIANWLTNAGINLNNLSTSSGKTISEPVETEIGVVSGEDDGGRIDIDPDYTPSPVTVPSSEETKNSKYTPTRSSNSTGDVNVNLDNVNFASGDLEIDGSKVGEISSEFPNISKYTKNGLTIYLAGVANNTTGNPGDYYPSSNSFSNITSKTFSQLTTDQKTIVAGLFKWWAKEALQLNEESYGLSFDSDTAQVKEIGLYFYNSNNSGNTLAAVYNWSTSGTNQNTTKLMLNVNMHYYSGIADTNLDGEGTGTSGFLDRTLAHEFTHAVMATNIHYFNTLPKFIKEGSAELTHGIDDERGHVIFQIAYDDNWLDKSLDLSNTDTGSQAVGDGYSGGYMFLRYLARQAALQSLFDGITISSDDNPLLITLTANADNYSNTLEGATINALDGNDTIDNNADNVSINGGAGNDEIANYGLNVTINAGAGNDSIGNHGGYDNGNDLIDAGDGNDTIDNHVHDVTLRGGAGNDYIVTGDRAIVEGDEGNDTIFADVNNGDSITIRGGAGNDSIRLSDDDFAHLIQYNKGDGNDIIEGFNATSTLSISGSTYSSKIVGDDIIVTVGDNKITLSDAATLESININGVDNKITIVEGTTGNDDISNMHSEVTINAFDGNDTIYNNAVNVTINAGAGNDSIGNHGGHQNGNDLIDAGAGDDTIDNHVHNVTLKGGAGNDYIVTGDRAIVEGDEGNDTIFADVNNGDSITIRGGAGNDSIRLSDDNFAHLIQYNKGDGNDIIEGFSEKSTLDLAGAKYATTNNGNDLILTVGTGKITLANAATLSNLNIIGTYSEDTTPASQILVLDNTAKAAVSLGSDTKYADASARTKAIRITGNAKDNSIVGGTANDTLEGLAGNDTLTGGNGNDIFVYTGGNDVITDYDATKDKISLASDLTYKNYAINGSDLILGYGTNNSLTIADGVNKTITSVVGKTTTTNIYTTEGIFDAKKTSVTLASTSGNFDASNYSALVTIDGAATSAIKITGNAKANQIIAGNSGSTLNGKAGNDMLQGGNGSDTFVYENKSGNKTIVNYGAGDKISLDSNATLSDASVNKTGDALLKVSGNTLTVKNSSNVTLNAGGNDIIYNGSVFTNTTKTNATLPATFAKEFNLGSFKNADSSSRTGAIKITGNNDSNSIVGSKGNDTLDGAAGNDTLTGEAGADIFVYTGGNDVITDYETKDKISLASDITYTNYALSGNDLILGYGTNNSLTVKDGNNKAITSVVGKTSAVNIYTTEGISDPKKTAVTLASTSGDFDAESYPALVTIDGSATDSIKITGNAKANKIVAGVNGSTLNGVKGNDTLQGGKGADTFIYENKSGNKTIIDYGTSDKISLDSNATLTDASLSKTGDAVLKVSGNTLTAKNSSSITLTANGKDTIYTSGVFTDSTKVTATLPTTFAKEFNLGSFKNADSSSRTGAIKITGNTQDNSIVGGKGNDTLDGLGGNDTLEGGLGNDLFVFTGGKDVITDYDASKDKISVDSSLTYSNFAISGSDLILGYGANNSLTVKDGKDAPININSVSKVYSDDLTFDPKKTSVTLAATSGNFNAAGYPALVTIDGAATKAIKITGNAKANKIIAGNSGSTLNGGTGNDTLQGGKGVDIFAYENKSGNKTIVDYGTGDRISLDSNATLDDASVNKAGDAVLKVSGNTLTVKNSSNVTLNTDGNDIVYNGSVFTDSTKANATLPATFAKEFNLGSFKNADSSSRTGAIKITGNKQDNSIVGSKGNDTLDGAAGNDTLEGGAGNDIFVFTGGKDVITDYDASKDKISVDSSLTYSNFAISGSDLILGYGANNSLTVKDGKDAPININSVSKVYSDDLTFDPKKTSVTLAATSGNFNAAGYPALVTIDGAATKAIKITGNAKANKIIAGNSGSTLNGGTGNDTLQGGKGADIFAYENKSGNKTIVNYGAGDKISLDSNATLSDASVNKTGDTILKVGSNSITIKDSAEVTIISDGVEMIYGGGVFTDSTKTNATLPATFAKEFNLGSFINADSSGRSGAIKIIGNTKNNSIVGSKGNDTLDGAAGNDTLTGGAGADIFVYSSGNDFITDYDTKDKISIDGELVYTNYAISGNNVVLNYSVNKSLTIKDAKDTAITSFTGKKTNVNVYSTAGIFDSKKTMATLASSTTNFDASTDYSALVTIDGTAATKAIKIIGNTKANKIYAGAYGSTLNGGTGNDTLIGDSGTDIFIYENKSGNKFIDNCDADDKISLGAGATITDAWTKNNVSTIKIGSNSVTINSADDITFASNGVETIYSGGIFTTQNTAKVYGSYTGTINLDKKVTTADATLASKAVTVQGGTANDSILGGASADKLYGNAGKDTLNGGKGNDTLWGGAGNDNFIYKANEGNDVIADYATGDLVTILDKNGDAGAFSKATFSNNTLTMNITGGGALTLKDVASSTTFNINGDNYHVKDKTIAK